MLQASDSAGSRLAFWTGVLVSNGLSPHIPAHPVCLPHAEQYQSSQWGRSRQAPQTCDRQDISVIGSVEMCRAAWRANMADDLSCKRLLTVH